MFFEKGHILECLGLPQQYVEYWSGFKKVSNPWKVTRDRSGFCWLRSIHLIKTNLHILEFFYREMHFKFVKLITFSMEVRFKSYSSLSSRATVSPNLGASFLLSRWCSPLTVPQAEESAVERCVQLLEHAGECRARGVCVDGLHCYRARRVLLHHRACPTQQCSVCRQLEPLCHLHASRCQVITGSFITHHHLC